MPEVGRVASLVVFQENLCLWSHVHEVDGHVTIDTTTQTSSAWLLVYHMTELPNEIQDRILDFLHDSKPTLRACALVCRAWVPTSRYHIFSDITLRTKDVPSFEVLSKDPNCTIRSCRHLEIHYLSTKIMKALQHLPRLLSPRSLHFKYAAYPRVLAAFGRSPSVEYLQVDNAAFNGFYQLDDVLVNFPNVRELTMLYCRLPPDGTYDPNYRSIIPRLRSLKLLTMS